MEEVKEPQKDYRWFWRDEAEKHRASFGDLVRSGRNRLGLTQRQLGELVGLKQAEISNYENGVHLPQYRDIVEKIADALEFQGDMRAKLFEYAGFRPVIVLAGPGKLADLEHKKLGLETPTPEQPQRHSILAVFDGIDKKLNDFRVEGHPPSTIDLAKRLSALARSQLSLSNHEAYRHELRIMLAKILFEQGRAHTEITAHRQLGAVLKPILGELASLAKTYEDPGTAWRFNMLVGILRYHTAMTIVSPTGRDAAYLSSVKSLDKALEMIDGIDEKLDVLRAIALDWAYLGSLKMNRGQRTGSTGSEEQQKFDYYVQKMDHIIGEGHASPGIICMVHEGVGRSQALLGNDRCFYTLEDNRARCEELTYTVPLRLIQNNRSEIEALLRFAPKDARVERLVHEVRALAGSRYERYGDLVERICREQL